jgi:membrane fusion protein (multidrug efflux system)
MSSTDWLCQGPTVLEHRSEATLPPLPPGKTRPFRGLATLFIAVALGFAVSGCNASDASEKQQERTAKVPAAGRTRVEIAALNESLTKLALTVPGEIEGSRDAMLGAALGGYIESISVEAGSPVKQGQTLVRVDSASHAARLEQAKVELNAAKRELDRAQALAGAIPKAELDAAQTRLDAANAALRGQQVNLNYSVIRAPFAGVVAQIEAEVGEVAAPGTPLLRLVRLDPVKVTVSVPGRDVVALSEGMIARVSTDGAAGVLEGKLAHIQRAADPKTRSFLVEVEVPNPDGRLLPGMIASVRLESESSTKRIVVAQDWLVTGVEQIGGFVEQAGVAKWRPVKLGPVVRNRVVVQEGLKVGDRLVITGHRELAEGDELLVARSGVCCTDGRVVFK